MSQPAISGVVNAEVNLPIGVITSVSRTRFEGSSSILRMKRFLDNLTRDRLG